MNKKVAFVTELSDVNKAGLFYAATSRIHYLIKNNKQFEVKVFNLTTKPTRLLSFLKSVLGKKKDSPPTVLLNGVKCEQLYYRYGLLDLFKDRILKINIKDYKVRAKRVSKLFEDFDIFAAHYGNGPGEFVYYLSQLLNKPYVITYHGTDIHTTPFNSEKDLKRVKRILLNSSANIFVSDKLFQTASKLTGNLLNGFVIKNSVDFSLFKPNLEIKEKIKEQYRLNEIVIGFVGNLVPVKNVMVLPEIFKNISRLHNNSVSFVIIGSGHLEKHIKKRFKEDKLNVLFLGRLPREKIIKWYNTMDILLLPSKNEGMPMVIIEALACGIRCFASRVGGIPEILPDEFTVSLDDNFVDKISFGINSFINLKQKTYIDLSEFDLDENAKKEGDILLNILNE